MACNSDDETLEHMILHCKAWPKTREQILPAIVRLLAEGENVIWSGLNDGDKKANPHGHYENLSVPKDKHKDHNRSGIPRKKTALLNPH